MKNKTKLWMLPLAGSLCLVAAGRAAEPAPQLERIPLDSTNRLTLSLRFGLNISGKFKNPGGSLNPRNPAGNGKHTPHGDRYNYDDGYVLPDNTGSTDGYTWNWGYDSSGQVNASAPNTIDFHRTTASSLPGSNSGDDTPYVGFEVAYNRELGVKEDWHNLRYGVEAAFNYMPINFNSGGTYNATLVEQTDTYGYTAGTTPPGAPYQGPYAGPGFAINTGANSSYASIPGTTITAHQHFYANLWGFRLGPYIESPLTEKFSLHFSGGLAAGIMDAHADWRETVTLPGGGGSTTTTGGGEDTSAVWGYYLGADAIYRFNERWALDVGVQFQDLGTYKHNFGGRKASLDLSQSLFVQAGISYSF